MEQTREEESNRIWKNIRQSGRLICHNVSIPKTCPVGKCDNYPLVPLCSVCNPCPCPCKYKTR